MRRLSEAALALIRDLYYPDRSFWGRIVGRNQLVAEVFQKLAALHEPRAIPYIAPFLVHAEEDICSASTEAIGVLARELEASEYVQLDEYCRQDWAYAATNPEWQNIKPSQIQDMWRLPDATIALGVAVCHGNGFVREAAINEIRKVRDGSELPFLLIRANDWVEPVRESAAAAILERIRPDYVNHLLRHLRLVSRLKSCGRSRHLQLVTKIYDLLQRPESFSAVQTAILSRDRWLRREVFHMTVAATKGNAAFMQEMLCHEDPVIRLMAVRTFKCCSNLDSISRLQTLMCDPFAPVRCGALEILAQAGHEKAQASIKEALLDTSASVRATARHLMQVFQNDFNFTGFYRDGLSGSSVFHLRAALLGLAETGNNSDAGLILPFLDHASIKIRRAAIWALASLTHNELTDRLLVALRDSHPGISREATRALSAKSQLPLDELLVAFRSQTHAHVRKNLFMLLEKFPFWRRGIFFFEALRDHDEHIIEMAQKAIRSWLAKSRSMATRPTDHELHELQESLKASLGMFTTWEVEELRFCFKTYE